jgi:hypothetical protein
LTQSTVKIPGTFHWARVYEGQEDEYEGIESYKVTFEPTDEGWDIYNKAKFKLKVRKLVKDDPDSPDVVTFRRKKEKKLFNGKVVFAGGPPKVLNEDGDEISDLIGNGSKGVVKLTRYVPKKGKMVGHHLEALLVTDLVHYEPPEEDDDEAPFEQDETPTPKKKKTPF